MLKPLERNRAIALRISGLSYSEIRRKVPVARSTLSEWFHNVGLSKPQKQRLTPKKLAAARRGARKLHEQKLLRVRRLMWHANREAYELLRAREMRWAIGTALYWAEGAKIRDPGYERFCFTNTDPAMILFIRGWLRRFCSVGRSDIKYALYIHQSADIQAARRFWVRLLGIGNSDLRIYLKKHNRSPHRRYVNRLYRGTIRLTVKRSTALNRRIAAWIRAMARAG